MGFRDVFKHKHTFIAVVHVESRGQALRNVEIAKVNGADGVFLINQNHEISGNDLFSFYRYVVRKVYSSYWIGFNCLDLYSSTMFRTVPTSVSGVWSDYAGYDEESIDPVRGAKVSWSARKRRKDWEGLYFGGVAFKYQRKVSDVGMAAKLSMPYMDVITTSGEKTGSAPAVAKIKKMRSAIGPDFPLAIASGMAPENVSKFMPYADCFLVATGISKNFTELDPERVARFAEVLGKK